MKRCIIIATLTFVCFMFLSADITSTTAGGNWNAPGTWIGAVVPTANDNVIINGTVLVNTTASCLDLTNSSTGILQNLSSSSFHLNVYGDVDNAGIIKSNLSGGLFYLHSGGDIVNLGTFTPYSLELIGATDQHVSSTGTFSPTFFTDGNSASALILLTDLNLSNTSMNLSNAPLVLNSNSATSNLSLFGGSLKNANIQGGDGATLTLSNNCLLQDVSGDEIVLAGDIMVASGVIFDSVINNGEIFNYSYSSYTMTINTRLENHGTIRNHTSGGFLYLNLLGDFYDYGTIRNSTLRFSNTVQRVLWQYPSADPISAGLVQSQATGDLQLHSDLRFSGSDIDLNGNTLVMYNGESSYGLSHSGGKLRNGILDTNGFSTLHLSDGVYIQSLNAEDIILQGLVLVADNCSFDSLINYATLQNSFASNYNLTIHTRLENRGTIRNHTSGGHFYLTLSGDLYDYGTMSNRILYLTNTVQRVLWQDPSAEAISCNTIQSLSTGNLQLLSDLRFSGSNIDLHNNTLMMYDGENSFGLSLSGGRLYNATLDTDGFSTLDMSDGAYLNNLNAGDIIFNGIVMVAADTSFDSVINNATVQNYHSSSYTMTINTRLENRGIIKNHASGGHFYLTLAGDLYDYGTLQNRILKFSNTEQRVLWQDPSAEAISCNTIQSTSTGDFQVMSDLSFSGSDINFNGNTLMLYNGRSTYGIKLSGGKLANAILDTAGFSTLDMSNGAYLADLTAEDIIFQGTAVIAHNCNFDDVVNHGIIQNYSVSSYPLFLNGNLVNYGTIKNHPSGGHLYLSIRKDLSNYGTIQNNRVWIDGAIDQYILNTGTISASIFQLVSEIGSAYWFYNGVLPGSVSAVNKTVDPNIQGVWQPRTAEINGRYITIGNGATDLPAPENLTIYFNLGEMKLRWDQVSDAIYYNVYTSSTPDASFTLLEKAFDNELGDGKVLITLTDLDTPRFYKVTAGN
ncbi:MAG: hypothetical protein PHY48_11605 [Candidatus Cloacimonetes bacterium]|nr:hypothetical protein [Candidatus Cloacimonadota bacterium]